MSTTTPARILVTGGAGFIGSAYVRMLLGPDGPPGVTVTVLDKLTYAGTLTNLASVLADPRFRFVRGDICDPALVGRLTAEHDQTVHFAAESPADRPAEDSGVFVRTNTLGTRTLLDAAVRHGTRRFVHVSTGEVYGPIAEGSWTEDRPLAPDSPWSVSKASSDLLALEYHRELGLDVRITRSAGTYGPHQFPDKVIPFRVTRLIDGHRVPPPRDGAEVRGWVHVEDHCRGIELARTGGRPGRTYNIGGGTELSAGELTGLLLEACGAGWERVRGAGEREGRGGSGPRYAVDWRRARDELGYRPRHGLADGLARTVAWYRARRDWWEPLT
ncbi:GDP-mannose 4,6-dehydratase [Streptomyces sp. NBC_01387]|uniref:dTDP-glucose 4,6-dehydratase n=1 Tax=unclassified Streptomyces TaxID=2593676 RepID=UPI0022530C68|nr:MULTISPECIES: GDP-mannose 4,6-dehydratase [unclassified Streptomyces]MCX4550008.1 GDP-mannose 4,6-dehydratase [Streptomyces sp. NBC_01500]WSC21517.1 GDP-mannose 4,6-dehydratase [Streptomyces sp. NBC_01766]WSV55473.1 GDP-mannose 4,6-dehydratase [Streptomyces sp. NBC_01014]